LQAIQRSLYGSGRGLIDQPDPETIQLNHQLSLNMVHFELWRTHSCVPRRHSWRRMASSRQRHAYSIRPQLAQSLFLTAGCACSASLGQANSISFTGNFSQDDNLQIFYFAIDLTHPEP
jgi:hypothetical protein